MARRVCAASRKPINVRVTLAAITAKILNAPLDWLHDRTCPCGAADFYDEKVAAYERTRRPEH